MVKVQKSRSQRRVRVKTPGGNVVIHYVKRNPAKAKCADCGKELAGVLRARPYKMQNASKTSKRPQRPYGGKLCSSCTRKLIISQARQ